MKPVDRFPFFKYTRASYPVKIGAMKDWAERILLYLPREIRSRTYHGPEHTMDVLLHLEKILPIFCRSERELNDAEKFVLECAAWLHDIGYILPDPDLHAQNSHQIIKRFGREYFDLEKAERTIVSWICRAHEHHFPLQNVPKIQRLHGQVIRTRKLAALFAFADACDVSSRRAPEIVYKILKDELATRFPTSVPHWKANQSIEGVYISSEDDRVYLNALNYRYSSDVKRKLQEELDRSLEVLGDAFSLRTVKCTRLSEPP